MKFIGLLRRSLKKRSIFQTLIYIALEWLDTQARSGVLPLNNNLHRYSVLSLDRNCAFCIYEIENEHHLLFKCPMYADLRRKFIADSSFRSLKRALEARNQSLCRNVSKLIFHATNKFLMVSVGMGDTAVVPKLIILCVCDLPRVTIICLCPSLCVPPPPLYFFFYFLDSMPPPPPPTRFV